MLAACSNTTCCLFSRGGLCENEMTPGCLKSAVPSGVVQERDAERLKGEAAPVFDAPSKSRLAIRDILGGAVLFHVWGLLGSHDIRQRYRRSALGPFWLTISMGTMVGALGVLYAGLFKSEIDAYMPFLALGFVVWGFISGMINDGCVAFVGVDTIIKQVGLPLSVHVYRVVWRNLIIFAHNIIIFFVVAVIFRVWPGWAGLLSLPGLVLLSLNGVWIGLLLGLISARFRDVPQIVASVVQVAFFLTPIIWKPEQLPDRPAVVDFNPFHHLMEVVRKPLLGETPAPISWIVVVGLLIGGGAVTFAFYRRFRGRVAYWV